MKNQSANFNFTTCDWVIQVVNNKKITLYMFIIGNQIIT